MGDGTHRPFDCAGTRLQFTHRFAYWAHRLGAAGLSLHSGGSFQVVWGLHSAFGLGHSYFQQHFLGADLPDALSDRRKNLRSCSSTGHSLDMGTVSLPNLLAGARGVGDEFERVSVYLGLLSYAKHG